MIIFIYYEPMIYNICNNTNIYITNIFIKAQIYKTNKKRYFEIHFHNTNNKYIINKEDNEEEKKDRTE